jgi:hypothetical protein
VVLPFLWHRERALVGLELTFTPVPYVPASIGVAWEDSDPADGGYPEIDLVTVTDVTPIDEDGRILPVLRASDGSLSEAEAERWGREFTKAYAHGPFARLREQVDERCMNLADRLWERLRC